MSVIPCTEVASVPDSFRCGEDFCQACGDCLACYAGDGCAERDWKEHTYAPSETTADLIDDINRAAAQVSEIGGVPDLAIVNGIEVVRGKAR